MWWHTGYHTGRSYHVPPTYLLFCSQTACQDVFFVETFVKKRRLKPFFLWCDGIPDTVQGSPTTFLVHIPCFAPKLLSRRIFCRNLREERAVKTRFLAGRQIWIRIGSGFNGISGSGSGSVFGIRIRIKEGKNDPQKVGKKSRNLMFWSAGCSLLRAEGFFCNLDVLYGGLEIEKL